MIAHSSLSFRKQSAIIYRLYIALCFPDCATQSRIHFLARNPQRIARQGLRMCGAGSGRGCANSIRIMHASLAS